MSPGRIVLSLLVPAGALAFWACSDSGRPPAGHAASGTTANAAANGVGGAAGSGGSAAVTGGGPAVGGSAGAAGADATPSGTGGSSPHLPAECGDGVVAFGEDCEPGQEAGASCQTLGFDSGRVECGADCQFDISDCKGTENCHDGRDNDGDGVADCVDADCQAACGSSCDTPPTLVDGKSVSASTEGRASELDASCSSQNSGAEVVFMLDVASTGKLSVALASSAFLTVSAQSSCAADALEFGCAQINNGQAMLDLDVTSGETVYLVVEGWDAATAGRFSLSAASRAANVCGDAFVDELEQCDDGSTQDGDGCDASCQVESNEAEPNDQPDQATAYAHPLYGMIDPATDVDHFEFSVVDGPRDVTIEVSNLGSGFCAQLLMDPYLELLDAEAAILAYNDDGGDGYCPKLAARLEDGSYTVVVSESPNRALGVLSSFAYQLLVSNNE